MFSDLIWDVDGTIFDTYPAFIRAFEAALQDLDAQAPRQRIAQLCRQSLSGCALTLAEERQLDADDVLRRFQAHYAATPARDQPLFPGVIEVCTYVRSIGGQNLIITHRGGESLQRLLEFHHMADYFTDRLTRDDGFPRKPDPASFEEMIQRHHLERASVLAVGDRDIDVLAGRAAGVRTCLFGTRLPEVGADYTIAHFAELYRILVVENGDKATAAT
jgi:phosphoglycolate phosphatase-like HAD superfamily hydrolase